MQLIDEIALKLCGAYSTIKQLMDLWTTMILMHGMGHHFTYKFHRDKLDNHASQNV